MAWATCQYPKGRIDEAGVKLVTLSSGDPARDEAMEIINNWRSCHSYPLHIVAKTLKSRATSKVNRNTAVVRRIKRMPSIALKLRQNKDMKLSQMQDIGGCRAVLNDVSEVEQLVRTYDEAMAKHRNRSDRPFIAKTYNYIQNPKPDGYRGVHLIAKYQSASGSPWNGQRIEIQMRSRLQHAWATAVETCQTFTDQALKSKIKVASAEWLRFFSLMSSAIAIREKRPLVPATPAARAELKRELKELEAKENIIMSFTGWGTAMQQPVMTGESSAAVFLLELNIKERRLRLMSFQESEMLVAHGQYLAREKATEDDPSVQVVLVSADTVANLRRAYPNFYVDTSEFIRAIQQEIY